MCTPNPPSDMEKLDAVTHRKGGRVICTVPRRKNNITDEKGYRERMLSEAKYAEVVIVCGRRDGWWFWSED